jgi:hypothetical protein
MLFNQSIRSRIEAKSKHIAEYTSQHASRVTEQQVPKTSADIVQVMWKSEGRQAQTLQVALPSMSQFGLAVFSCPQRSIEEPVQKVRS